MCHGEAHFCKIYYPMSLVLMLSASKKKSYQLLKTTEDSESLEISQMCARKSLNRVQLFATLWNVAHQAPLYMEFSRGEYWSA